MADETHLMQCSEVWGGNDEVDRAVAMPGLDAWVLSKPSGGAESGGDIHYVSSCATGRITRILVADVAGHGSEVSALALRLRGLMRRFVNYIDQTRLMALVNKEFAAIRTEGRFATALLATYWGPTGDLEVTSAGHPPPLLFRAEKGTWDYLTLERESSAQDLPLGVLDEARFGRTRLRMRPGDVMMLYTDALLEARAEGGPLVGPRQLLDMARAVRVPDDGTFARTLVERVREYSGRDTLDDDATVLALRRNDVRRPRGSIRAGLSAVAQFAKEISLAVAGKGPQVAWPEARRDNLLGAWMDRFNRR